MSLFDNLAHKMGYISQEEALYRSLPRATKEKIEAVTSDLELMANPGKAYKAQSELIKEIMKSLPAAGNIGGYEQAGSVLRRRFRNTFELHTFILEGHWAAVKARRHNRVEFERDGYVLMADSRVGKKQVKKVQAELEDLGISGSWKHPAKRSDMFDHIKSFSNLFVANPAMFGGQDGIDVLLPQRITPVYNTNRPDEIEAWEYQWNNKLWTIPYNSLDHVRSYSLSKEYLGTPMLASVVVDIEADLHASAYMNTMWQKGGLIKAIVSMENPNSTGINQNSAVSFAQELQNLFVRTMAGAKGGGSLMFLPPVKGVHNIINPKDLEGPYADTSERIAIKVCELLGCPPESIGLSRSSQYVNAAATLDFATLSVDNDNYFVASLVDQYITQRIIEEVIGVQGVFIQQKGEFGAISKICAEFGLAIAQMGCDVMTVNEFRVKVLHWQPLLDSRGDQYLGHYINEANMLKASKPETSSKERKEIFEDMVGPKEVPLIQGRDITFLRYDPKEIKYWDYQ